MQQKIRATPNIGGDGVVKALQESYFSERQKHVEASILSPYRLTLQQFLKDGLAIFGEKKFDHLSRRVESYDLGIDLMLGGWCQDGLHDPRIVTVSHPGSGYDHVLEGAHAIGAGAPIALGHLDACHNVMGTLDYAIYQTLSAKLMSEAERSVGSDTVLLSMDESGAITVVDNKDCERFRELWNIRRRAAPQDLIDTLKLKPGTEFGFS
jgi:hypothetical protein